MEIKLPSMSTPLSRCFLSHPQKMQGLTAFFKDVLYLKVMADFQDDFRQRDGHRSLLHLASPGLQLFPVQQFLDPLQGLHVVWHDEDHAGEFVSKWHLYHLQLLRLVIVVVVETLKLESEVGKGEMESRGRAEVPPTFLPIHPGLALPSKGRKSVLFWELLELATAQNRGCHWCDELAFIPNSQAPSSKSGFFLLTKTESTEQAHPVYFFLTRFPWSKMILEAAGRKLSSSEHPAG